MRLAELHAYSIEKGDKIKSLFIILFIVALGSSASIELVISEAQLQEALESAIDDSRISSLIVDIQDDLIALSAAMILPDQDVDLRLEIKRETDTDENCQTWCVVSGTANGNPINQARIELWNQWINSGMKSMAQTELGIADSVTIQSDEITFIWY